MAPSSRGKEREEEKRNFDRFLFLALDLEPVSLLKIRRKEAMGLRLHPSIMCT